MKQAGLYVLLSNASTHVHQFRGIPALPFVPHQPCDHGLQVQYTSLHCCTRHNCQTSLTSKLAALTKSSSHGAHLVTWRAKKCLHAHRSPQRAQAPAEKLYTCTYSSVVMRFNQLENVLIWQPITAKNR